jgi:hypothetical protein
MVFLADEAREILMNVFLGKIIFTKIKTLAQKNALEKWTSQP